MKVNVYLITNISNSKKYVGITKFPIEYRFAQHTKIRSCPLLKTAIDKYGVDNFSLELLEIVDDYDTAFARERYYINIFNSFSNNHGYNMTTGGKCQCKYSNITKSNIRTAIKGKRAGELNGMFGNAHTEAARYKIGLHSQLRNTLGPNPRARPVVYNDLIFSTKKEAAAYLKIHISTLTSWLNTNKLPNLYYAKDTTQ